MAKEDNLRKINQTLWINFKTSDYRPDQILWENPISALSSMAKKYSIEEKLISYALPVSVAVDQLIVATRPSNFASIC